jgi:type VI secretion system secreted protein Hcp
VPVDMFLKLDKIKGEAKDDTHKDEIDVLAWSWGAHNSGHAHFGGGAGAGKVSVQDISITKWVDLASTSIEQAVCTGQHIDTATITVRKAGEKPLEYLTITLKEVFITSFSNGGSGGEDKLTENITLNFASFKTQYKEQSASGAAASSPDFSFHITQNKKL